MATEKRLIEIIECLRNCANNTGCERCSRWLYHCDEHCVDDLMATAAEELEKLVNSVEVKHGRWIESTNTDYMMSQFTCSECGVKYIAKTWNYCPNCGAKMDGDGNAAN